MDQTLYLLNQAADVLMAPANKVTHSDRVAAEQTFVSFRQSKQPFDVCRHILVNCETPYVQFIAASTICEALVREWATLSHDQVDSLQTFMLSVIVQKPRLDGYIREKLLVACIVILKKSLLNQETSTSSQTALFAKVNSLLSSGSCLEVSLGCAVLRAMLRECALYSSSSNAGLAWAPHCAAKSLFQTRCLPDIFQLINNMLRQYMELSSLHSLDADSLAILGGVLDAAELTLSWDFNTSRFQQHAVMTFSAFRPGKDWIPLVLKGDMTPLMFKLYALCKESPQLSHLSLRCLAQLASMRGPVMQNSQDEVVFVMGFLQLLIPLLQSEDFSRNGGFSLAFANIIAQLETAHDLQFWTSFDESVFQTFAFHVAKFACQAAQHAKASEQAHDSDEAQLYQEAFDKLLDCWLVWTITPTKIQPMLLPQSVSIFEAYLSWRLKGTSSAYQDDEEVDELDEDDRVQYENQLCTMGCVCRVILPTCLPMLCQLLEERLNHWVDVFRQCYGNASLATSPEVSSSLSGLYEDLHWLVLLAGHTLCYDCLSGETPTIPKPVCDFCTSQQSQLALEGAHSYVAMLQTPITDKIQCPDGADPVVRLMVDLMRIADFQRHVNSLSQKGFPSVSSSPQLSRSIFWYLRCWCSTYVMYDSSSNEAGPALARALSLTGDGRTQLQWLVDLLTAELPAWVGEPDVLEDLSNLLGSLTECPIRFHLALSSENFRQLTLSCIVPESWLRLAGSKSSVGMLSALVKGCSSLTSTHMLSAAMARHFRLFSVQLEEVEQQFKTFLRQVLAPLHDRFIALNIGSAAFVAGYQQAQVLEEVMSLLSLLRGVLQGASISSASILFSLFQGICLPSKPGLVISDDELRAVANGSSIPGEEIGVVALIKHYAGHSDVLVNLLELLRVFGQGLLPIITNEEARLAYAVLLRAVNLYASCNVEKIRSISRDDAEDQLEDLVVFLKLFDLVTSRDFWNDDEEEDAPIAGVDVVFCGLNMLLPLISEDILLFPKLCEEFFRVVCFLAEFHADRVVQLPDELFRSLMQLLELGISNYGAEVMKLCLEGVASIGDWYCLKGHRRPDLAERLKPVMAHFLKIVFNKVFVSQVDGMGALTDMEMALFPLICCCEGLYHQYAEQLVSLQPDTASQQRLLSAFKELIPPGLQLIPEHTNKTTFSRRLHGMLESVLDLLNPAIVS